MPVDIALARAPKLQAAARRIRDSNATLITIESAHNTIATNNAG
jgi:hypothetical protein